MVGTPPPESRVHPTSAGLSTLSPDRRIAAAMSGSVPAVFQAPAGPAADCPGGRWPAAPPGAEGAHSSNAGMSVENRFEALAIGRSTE
jgi:hypothetical protein